MPLDDVAPEVVADPTPPSVRAALDVMARLGCYLTPEKLDELSSEDSEAIGACIIEFMPAHAVQIAEAADENTVLTLMYMVCGQLNRWFDQEATWNLHALPEQEREVVRAQPVNQKTWRQLHTRARWHSSPRRFRREAHCPALRLRRGGQRTRRVRRVASSPRRARAPSHLGDEPPLAPSRRLHEEVVA
jgi:hypothetical protein